MNHVKRTCCRCRQQVIPTYVGRHLRVRYMLTTYKQIYPRARCRRGYQVKQYIIGGRHDRRSKLVPACKNAIINPSGHNEPLTVGTHLYDADSDIRAGLIKLILSTPQHLAIRNNPASKSRNLKVRYRSQTGQRINHFVPFKIFIAYYSIPLKTQLDGPFKSVLI